MIITNVSISITSKEQWTIGLKLLYLLEHHWFLILLLVCMLVLVIPVSIVLYNHFRFVGIERMNEIQIAHNVTTQEYRKNGMKIISNPIYDYGIKQNFVNELFTFHPSLLASTVVSSKKHDVDGKGSYRRDQPHKVSLQYKLFVKQKNRI